MTTFPPCEFRDPDGAYLLVQPLDEIRGRVLASNVTGKGEVLYKTEFLSWTEASEDLGSFTRLGPAELVGATPVQRLADPDDPLRVLDQLEASGGEHRHPDPEGDKVDPKSVAALAADYRDGDPRAELLRLAIHYWKTHIRGEGGSRWLSSCECPGHGPAEEPARSRLHALMSLGIITGKLPTLPRIYQAIREAGRPAERVA